MRMMEVIEPSLDALAIAVKDSTELNQDLFSSLKPMFQQLYLASTQSVQLNDDKVAAFLQLYERETERAEKDPKATSLQAVFSPE